MTFDEWFELKKEKCEVYGNGDDFCVDDEIKHLCKMAWDEQQKQIEKMKCCGNCQKLRVRFDSKTNINFYCSDSDMKQIEVGFQMCCCKWEIKEND